LTSGAHAYIPTYRKNFLKFWWCEELDLLKDQSIQSDKLEGRWKTEIGTNLY